MKQIAESLFYPQIFQVRSDWLTGASRNWLVHFNIFRKITRCINIKEIKFSWSEKVANGNKEFIPQLFLYKIHLPWTQKSKTFFLNSNHLNSFFRETVFLTCDRIF